MKLSLSLELKESDFTSFFGIQYLHLKYRLWVQYCHRGNIVVTKFSVETLSMS